VLPLSGRACRHGCADQHSAESVLLAIEGIYRDDRGTDKALVVADALYCGVCRPKEDPVELPQLR
jgi:hypothetical protein